MPEIKCVINDVKSGKSYTKPVEDQVLFGRKVGEKLSGAVVGLPGYELIIAGGSDSAGFPMVKFLDTGLRKRLILNKGLGLRTRKKKALQKSAIKRRALRGSQINNFTAQLNLKIVQYGSKSVEELLGIPPKVEEVKPAQ
ncbi:MAG: S6e family ribosomal protein [Nanoarchaeota archaeon]|nr:S6e family ribosomal protein [Nanoarchaeota archaeon]